MVGFAELSILISLAALLGLLANKLKQPPLLGYILAGVIIGSLNIFGKEQEKSLELFSQIGVTFLLFILGLELNISELKKLGKTAMITGIGQILFTTIFGYLISVFLGFTSVASLYIAIGLTFSSTIVIVKLLTSKNELHSLHGKISIGFLLVQDFAAMFILISLIGFGTSSADQNLLMQTVSFFIKFPIVIFILWIFGKFILPWVIDQTGHDREVLFLIIIGWALFFSTLVSSRIFGFTTEVGALLAGIALSSSKEFLQIETWTKSLRDFFLTVFFVMLGLHIDLNSFGEVIIPALIFSVFVLIGNPLIVMIIMGILGYQKRTSFFTSLTVAQISEFSLLVAALGLSLGHLTEHEIAILTVVGGATMAISSYLIYYNQKIYSLINPYLSVFEFNRQKKRGSYSKRMLNHTIIFGFHRLGGVLIDLIEEKPKEFLIVDHNPKVIDNLQDLKINSMYGDMMDSDLFERLSISKSKLIISTVPNLNANINLINYATENKLDVPIVVTANDDIEVKKLYDMGATYVLYPHLRAGKQLRRIAEHEENEIRDKLENITRRELNILEKRFHIGNR